MTTTAVGGQTTVSGGALTPAGWVLWVVITVMVGRLWRGPWNLACPRAADHCEMIPRT